MAGAAQLSKNKQQSSVTLVHEVSQSRKKRPIKNCGEMGFHEDCGRMGRPGVVSAAEDELAA